MNKLDQKLEELDTKNKKKSNQKYGFIGDQTLWPSGIAMDTHENGNLAKYVFEKMGSGLNPKASPPLPAQIRLSPIKIDTITQLDWLSNPIGKYT